MKVKLKWAKDFKPRHNKQFSEAQEYVDTQCIKRMREFVPVAVSRFPNAGKMRNSIEILSPGKIIHKDKKARSEYYNHGKHTHTGDPKAKPMWFEVMKTKYKREIILGAAKLAGGKPK